ncbi:MAG: magnesium transporter CorA family protein [Mycetocola sp.]
MATVVAFRDGRADAQRYGVSDLPPLISDPSSPVIWVDTADREDPDLVEVAAALGLHPLAVTRARTGRLRPGFDRFDGHTVVTMMMPAGEPRTHIPPPDASASEDRDPTRPSILPVHQPQSSHKRQHHKAVLVAMVTPTALLTIRPHNSWKSEPLTQRWNAHPELVALGPVALLWAALDVATENHIDAITALDQRLERLESSVFASNPDTAAVQHDAYQLYKALTGVRHIAVPLREASSELLRDPSTPAPTGLIPYLQDVREHAQRVVEWSDSLRELINTIIDTNMTAQSNRMNLIMKKVTSWAAVIAVPTLVTGVFGMNVPLPWQTSPWATVGALVLMGATSLVLYVQFKRKDWL